MRCQHILAMAILCFSLPALAAELNQPPAGFKALFNGKDLSGWWGETTTDPRKYIDLSAAQLAARKERSMAKVTPHWSVQNGELINDGQGLYLTTDEWYGDFELLLEYRTVPKADSGIYLRGVPQVQIWDSTEPDPQGLGKSLGSGGLWNNSAGAKGKDPIVLADNPLGEWNQFRIVMVGERVSVWLNDKLIVNHARMENYYNRKIPVPARGPIQLQTHGGEIRWRNVFIREIDAPEANAILRNAAIAEAGGYVRLFNGKDLTGWKGATANYEVVDGAIRCKQGHGGNLLTEKEYGDFEVLMEINLPEGGNNGLAIRYPGQGDAAYAGMAELQVLHNGADKYKNLDARQYHGSAYGMAAAHRGFQREPGVWQFQRVRVQGTTIEVELNGVQILNADVSKIEDYMANSPHPGKLRTSGFFGFAGHNDPVQFRELYIRELE